MSIPSTGHTIYSFITLCLKEQRDITGRKERWGEKRVPSLQKTYLGDSFIGREAAAILGPPYEMSKIQFSDLSPDGSDLV